MTSVNIIQFHTSSFNSSEILSGNYRVKRGFQTVITQPLPYLHPRNIHVLYFYLFRSSFYDLFQVTSSIRQVKYPKRRRESINNILLCGRFVFLYLFFSFCKVFNGKIYMRCLFKLYITHKTPFFIYLFIILFLVLYRLHY